MNVTEWLRSWSASYQRKSSWLGLLLVLLLGGASRADASESSVAAFANHCLVCGMPIGDNDLVLTVRGREVRVHAGHCNDEWLANPELHFAKLQSKGALFTESSSPSEPPKGPWFWFGVYMITGLISSAASAYVAVNRGQQPATWFFAGLVGNVAALAVLFFIIPRGAKDSNGILIPAGFAKVAVTRAPRPCTHCNAAVHPAASFCAACGKEIVPLVESEVRLSKQS